LRPGWKKGPQITQITQILLIMISVICVNLCNLWTFEKWGLYYGNQPGLGIGSFVNILRRSV
jgi:hypothetical protein